MKKINTLAVAAALAVAGASLSGCAGMSRQDTNTALGAGIGGLAGSALIGGTAATVGGAVIGGVVGNQAGR